MPIDRSNGCHEYLKDKISKNHYNNLKYTNLNGQINKITSFLDSHQIKTSVTKGRLLSTNRVNKRTGIRYIIDDFDSLRQEYDFESHSWILNAYFDNQHPDNSVLNVAFPSAVAYYYVTLVFPGNDYTFSGKFLDENNYESSLTVYTADGNLNPEYVSVNTYNTNLQVTDNIISPQKYDYISLDNNKNLNYRVINKTGYFFWVLQRFYVNMSTYNVTDLNNNLFTVYDNKKGQYLPALGVILRNELSSRVTINAQKLLSFIAEKANSLRFSPFYFPQSSSGLFPDGNHFYLVSLPGEHQLFKVTGSYTPSSVTPYIDFITVNQDTTATDNGIPFYDFLQEDNSYEIYVATDNISLEEIKSRSQNENPIVLRYAQNNNDRMLIFRIITYSQEGISQIDSSSSLSPSETEKQMTSGFYPTIVTV